MSDGHQTPDNAGPDQGPPDSAMPSTEAESAKKPIRTAFDDGALKVMEDEFQTVLNELVGGDRSLDKFRSEYEKLHKALLKSHDSEKRLMQKCRELNAELVTNSAKVQSAMKLSDEDKSAIASLRKEIEKAWKMVDAAHEKEQRAKETIQSLRIEINNLSKLVEQGAGVTMGQEHDVNDLMKMRDELAQERDRLLNDVTQLRRDLDDNSFKQADLEKKIHESNEQILTLQEKITQSKTENMKEAKRREQIELELKTSKQSLEVRNAEFKAQTTQFESQQQELRKAQQHLKQMKEDNIRLSKDNQILQVRLDNSRTQFTELVTTNEKLANDCARRVTELKEKEDELVQLRKERDNEQKKKDHAEKRFRQVEDQVGEVEQQRERLRSKISTLEHEIDQFKKTQDENRRQIDTLTREREQLNKNCQKLIADNQKQTDQVKSFDQSKKTLEQDITNYKEEASKQRKIILKMEKERDRYITEAGQLTNSVLGLMEEVKKKELELFDQKKKIAELETRLKQQQNLYEAVRSDRNLYSKNLIESQDEIGEMKRKLKIMNHQIDQLKEEIQGKEQELVRAQGEHEKVKKDKEQLMLNVEQLKKEAIKKEEAYANQQSEFERLNKQLMEANDERKKQMKQLQQVIAERDVLGTQLVRRNDELALLYEKLKIQQSTLNKGELQYKSRLEDLRILKLELKKLRHDKGTLQDKVSNTEDLKREVFHVQRELLRERTRCRALEEELENPMNIHRWRKLEGSDPSTFELIQKIQLLQKRLIQKTEEVVQKELLIQEKEKLYAELKRILARQPGPEVAEQLSIYQETLKAKTKQLKSLASEVNMYESQIDDYKYEIDKLNRQLTEVQQKYFLQKKKETMAKEKERFMQAQQLTTTINGITLQQPPPDLIQPNRSNDQARFTGGGFNLKSTPKPAAVNA
ncbi:unnamed protein product [Rotaria socialis]|uniref:Cilia- and flagella-associated protein 58 central coiled coil domain-containing protein n=8 Tax=Rotaria socialis TaxID=392032 RepID=A0A817V076_9BILA|nr:unnamed protein product [Rotaria socialis]CAF3338686.1 unnamed protein product [Rotaria socialis]CAF3403652.1 unnamed protein product [Rotaria socialis]CAF3753202.1 unnamed protein product [Rotaria socialis]CAF4439933.1 unnamed protein product [Rotaria socialis]